MRQYRASNSSPYPFVVFDRRKVVYVGISFIFSYRPKHFYSGKGTS
jgi:hypothetical protein